MKLQASPAVTQQRFTAHIADTLQRLPGGTPTPNADQVRLVRLPEILNRLSISRSTWYAGIQSGRFPRGHALGARLTVWRSDDIDQVINTLCAPVQEAA